MTRDLSVSLTGGLGNQLFQYAALLHFGENRAIGLTQDFGKPRLQHEGKAELFAFKVNCGFVEFRKTLLSQKFAGYLLRLGVHRKWWEVRPLMRNLVGTAGSIYLSLVNRKIVWIKGYNSLGYSRDFTISRFTNLLVGYFQSEIWLKNQKVRNQMMQLSLVQIEDRVRELVTIAKHEKPLVVHVRLGDYKYEENLGVLPDKYYETSIIQAWETGVYRSIWLFSDESSEAINRIPKDLRASVRVIEDHFSAAESLELMRNGSGYVIANSTFSWWGAMLSYEESPMVIAPEKWFKCQTDPENLIPNSWVRVSSW